jgi:hypothetical protein
LTERNIFNDLDIWEDRASEGMFNAGMISFSRFPIATTVYAIALAFLARWVYRTNYRFLTGRDPWEE